MANIVVREPFREMMSLREAMDRLFEDSFVGPRWMGLDLEAGALAMDVYETDNDLVVTASVPGVKPEDVEITVTDDVLHIRGEVKSEEKVEKANYIRQERRFGRFERNLTLPMQVQAEKAEAIFENGVLKLTLPKAEAVKPKQIKIKAK